MWPLPALLACLIGCSAPSTQDIVATPRFTDGRELLTDCRTAPRPGDVRELDAWSTTDMGHPGFQGGDGAMSVELSDGRWLAAFGDTIRAQSYSGGPFARNSLLLIAEDETCLISGPGGSAVIPDRADGVGYWPMSLSMRSSGGVDEVVMMMQRVARTATDELGFVILGSSLVRLQIPHGGVPRVVVITDLDADDPSRSRMNWGAALWRGTDEWIYVFGTRHSQQPSVFGWSLHVARTTWRDLSEQRRWQFWDGQRWAARSADAATLIEAQGGVASVLSVFSDDDRWFAVSTRNGDLGDEVVVWDAPAPTGPYSPNPPSLELPPDRLDGMITYLTIAHPGLFDEPGTIVVSASRGSSNWEALVSQPLRYRPRFWRIDLPD